ncbi:MAG: DNA primase [Candidatus Liberibacter ctenarytainae]|uniref:DNA primase n=1 Tax=Candidatus Liberibacter ctenarytainae TaxID=2020335 RepID=A0A937DLM0_9HYPH|nr:DNA primase [Candidatus Liberibacter ctenarytainae]
MLYHRDFITDLLVRISISTLIGQYISWDRKKTNVAKGDYWACCPFHDEKTPSFHCDDRKGVYYCFSCHAKGNHFSFLSEILGCSFSDSVQKLADIVGIPLPDSDSDFEKKEKKRSILIEIMEVATRFFQNSLKNQSSTRLRHYLDERGISSHSIETFRLGYAPDSRHALREYLCKKGFSQEQISEVGLLIHGNDTTIPCDRFRDRIIFPILSSRGQVIAFGGRSLSKRENIKYLNSPETIFFHKKKVLYNFFGVLNNSQRWMRQDLQKQNSAAIVLVEGYTDVIALHQAGILNVVSSLGTSFTDHHLQLLWRLSSRVVLCFDGDNAGLHAAYKSIDLILCHLIPGKSVNFILLPEGDDPDSFVRRYGKKAFEKLLIESLPLVDFLWKRETESYSFETPDARAELEMRLKNSILCMKDKKLRYYYSQVIQDRLNQLFQKRSMSSPSWGKNRKNNARYEDKKGPSTRLMQSSLVKGKLSQKPSLREAALILTLINHPEILQDEYHNLIDMSYDHNELQKLWSFLFSEFIIKKEFTHEEIYQKLCMRGFGELLHNLDKQIRDAGLWSVTAEANIIDVRSACKQALELYKRFRLLSRQKEDIENQIAQMTEQGEEEKTVLLISILNEIHSQIIQTEHQDAIIEGFGKMSGRI